MGTDQEDLAAVACALAAPGKGLLASDESTGTIGKRFAKLGIENTEENRRSYRELLYTADTADYISGVIMYKETLYQSTSDGLKFVDHLDMQGVMPGIKVDEGLEPFGSLPGETHTKGLDSLRASCEQYVQDGARFAKWRAVVRIGEGLPSQAAVEINAKELASYAKICQECGLVPIVEPEILLDGDHDMQRFADVSETVIGSVFRHLREQGVQLDAILLKPQMVIPGAEYVGLEPTPEDIAKATLRVLRKVVPDEVPGIMFLSGGQTEEQATVNLDAINRLAQSEGGVPWALSFSYGRALQASVLNIWSQDRSNAELQEQAREMAAALAAANSLAARGEYEGPHPSLLDASSLHETFRGWSGNAVTPNGSVVTGARAVGEADAGVAARPGAGESS